MGFYSDGLMMDIMLLVSIVVAIISGIIARKKELKQEDFERRKRRCSVMEKKMLLEKIDEVLDQIREEFTAISNGEEPSENFHKLGPKLDELLPHMDDTSDFTQAIINIRKDLRAQLIVYEAKIVMKQCKEMLTNQEAIKDGSVLSQIGFYRNALRYWSAELFKSGSGNLSTEPLHELIGESIRCLDNAQRELENPVWEDEKA